MPTSQYKTRAVFNTLWSMATLFHLTARGEWPTPLLQSLLAAAALYLLCRPSAAPRLLLLAAVQLCESWTTAPFISNHWLFTGLINSTILLAYARLAWIHHTPSVDPDTFYRSFAPVVRFELIILYFFVVFHKLNTDFFDPLTSCAGHFYLAQIQRFPLLSSLPIGENSPIYFTLIIEAAIPLLLCLRPTRQAGILLGLVFHAAISFNPISGFYNFSSMLFALFFLFSSFDLESTSFSKLASPLRRWQSLSFRHQSLLAILAMLGALIALSALSNMLETTNDLVLFLWALYCIALFTGTVLLPKTTPERGLFSPVPGFLLLMPLLTILNGTSPYLGLKTETAFAMYSNLRTEGERSNHLLVPQAVQLFDFQQNLVEIKDSSSGFLKNLAQRRLLLPFFEVRAFLNSHPNTTLTYLRHAPPGAPPDDQLRQPIPWPLRKLLYFRPVALGGPQPCSH